MAGKTVMVCVKWVSTRTEVDPLTGEVTTDERFSGISPADSSALEWSLMLGTALGATVLVATVGPPAADKALTDAIACGANRAIRVDSTEQITSELTAAALASVAVHPEVVVCGDYSIDRGSGSVPAFLAHRLGLPQALGLLHLEAEEGQVVATRRLDLGRRERLALRLPAVISVEPGLELRRAGLSAILSAKSATIEIHSLPEIPDLPIAPVVIGQSSYKPRTRVVPAPTGDAGERIRELADIGNSAAVGQLVHADPSDAADIAIAQLREWGYL